MRVEGWSWFIVIDDEVTAVWSVVHGAHVLVADREVSGAPVDIYFRYFVQIDPAWLFDCPGHLIASNSKHPTRRVIMKAVRFHEVGGLETLR